MTKLSTLCIFTCLSACAPEQPSVDGSIQKNESVLFGGKPVPAGGLLERSTVFLVRKVDGQFRNACSATLIDPEIVVTAAHCVTKFGKPIVRFDADYEVYFGSNPLLAEERHVTEVVDIIFHPEFVGVRKNETWYSGVRNDIALLKIKGKLPGFAAPAVIDGESPLLPRATKVNLAGFGPPVFPGDSLFYLRTAMVTVQALDRNTGQNRFGHESGKIYATGGDSGGPVYLVNQENEPLSLVGVISTTYGFEPIAKHSAWIRETIARLKGENPVDRGWDH